MININRFVVQIKVNDNWINACVEKEDLLDAEYQYMSLEGYPDKRIVLRVFPTVVEWNGIHYGESIDTVIKKSNDL